jgi:hypothetical protein
LAAAGPIEPHFERLEIEERHDLRITCASATSPAQPSPAATAQPRSRRTSRLHSPRTDRASGSKSAASGESRAPFFNSPALHENIENFAVGVGGAPQVDQTPIEFDVHLVRCHMEEAWGGVCGDLN